MSSGLFVSDHTVADISSTCYKLNRSTFHHFEMTSHKLHVDMLSVRQVCKQCWTHAELDTGSLTHCRNKLETEETVCASLQTPASFSVGRFLLEKSQVRSLEIPLSVRQWESLSLARARACYLFTHGADLLISSLRRVTLYVTCVKTTSMDDTRTLQWHTPMYYTCWNARVRIRARADVAARYCIPIYLRTHTQRERDTHTHAARIGSKSCLASCHGLLTTRTGSAPHAGYLALAWTYRMWVCARRRTLRFRRASERKGREGYRERGGPASSVKVWLKRIATDVDWWIRHPRRNNKK